MADRSVTVTLVARIADYERGMAQATAATRRFESELNDLRGKATVDLAHVGETADDVSRDLDQLAATSAVAAHEVEKVGDNASEAGRDMLGLAARIEIAKTALHGLSLEFAGSGDRSLTPKIRDARRELAELQRIAKTLTPAAGAAGQGIISSLGDLGASLRGSMIPLLIGVGVAASPAIAAAVGAAVVGGVGLGGIIGGIALAARDPRVPAAFKPVGLQMMTGLTQDAAVFVQPLVELADDIGQGWEDRIRPHVANMFADLAPSLRALGGGGIGFLEHLAAGFEKVSRAAGPFLDQFARDLPELGASMESFFNSVAAAGPEVTRFFHDMNSDLGTTIEGLGKFIQFGAELNDVLPVGGLVASLARVADATDANVETNDAWIRSLFGVSGGLVNVNKALELHNAHSTIAADAAKGVAAAMFAMNNEFAKHASSAIAAGAANQELTASFRNAASAAHGLIAAFDELNGAELTQREAARQAEEALDNFRAAIKASDGSLSKFTPEGRAAARALDDIGRKAVTSAQSILDNGGTVEQARAEYNHYIGELRKAAAQAGLTKGQIDRLVNSIAKMPTHKTVNIKQAGADGARAAVNALAAAIRNVNSKTVTITTKMVTVGSGPNKAGFAAGTPSAPPGLAWVGERGPELMSLVGGERIYPHQKSVGMARAYAGGTGGGPSSAAGRVLTVNLAGAATPMERAVEQVLRRATWNLGGGNAQVAVGRS